MTRPLQARNTVMGRAGKRLEWRGRNPVEVGAGDLVLLEVPRKWPEPCKDQLLCLTPAPPHKWKLRRRNKSQKLESSCAASADPELTIKCLKHLPLKPCQPSTREVKAKECGIQGQLQLHSEFKVSFG